MSQVEKETNRLAKAKWTDTGILEITFSNGVVEKFDPRLTTVSIQTEALRYGFGVRFQRLGSLEVKDFPTVQLRMEEYHRRVKELREHYYSGTDSWDIPSRSGSGSAISEADLTECIDRCYPGKGQQLFNASLAKNGGDLPKTREMWLTTKQIATAWAKLQAERRETRAAGLGDADAMVQAMLEAAGQ